MIRRGFGIPSMLRYSCASLQLACILTLSDPASAGQPSAENQALLDQAALLNAQQKWDECIQVLKSVVAKADTDPAAAGEAGVRLGAILRERGRFGEALQALRAAKELNGVETGVLLRADVEIGHVFVSDGSPAAAVEPLESVANHAGPTIARATGRA